MAKFVPIMLWVWLIHAGIAAILSAPVVYFGRKRVHWHWHELLVFVVPFGIWFALNGILDFVPKNLSNVVIEPVIFGLAVPLAALVRVAIGTRISESASVKSLIGAVSVVAVGVFFMVPCLPE